MLDGLDAQADRQMAFADAGWALDQDGLGRTDVGAGGQGIDARALDRGLEREVEVGQRLAVGQARQPQCGAHAPSFARLVLGLEQRIDHGVGRMAFLDRFAEQRLELVGRVRQAQAEQALAGAVDIEPAPAHRATSASAA